MGRRSRKRIAPGEPPRRAAPDVPARPPVRSGRPGIDERPKAPWHPVPLVELSVLVGLVLCVLGLLNLESDRGRIMLVFGMALGSLGGLDTALREHFAGYRSHSTLLAGLPAVLLAAALYFAKAPWPVVSGLAIVAFGGAFAGLRRAFRRKSGGLSFR